MSLGPSTMGPTSREVLPQNEQVVIRRGDASVVTIRQEKSPKQSVASDRGREVFRKHGYCVTAPGETPPDLA